MLRLVVAFAAGAACAVWVMMAFFDVGATPPESPRSGQTSKTQRPARDLPAPRSIVSDSPATLRTQSASPSGEPSSVLPRAERSGQALAARPADPYRVEIAPATEFHEQMLRPRPEDRLPSSQRTLHDDLERERRDESWAHYAESLLRDFFRTPPFAGAIDARVIECRATLCEIQAISFAPEQVGYNRVLADLQIQPWYRNEFVGKGSASGGTADGTQGILIHLGRAGASEERRR